MLVPHHRRITRKQTLNLLDRLETIQGEARSLYMPHSFPVSEIEKMLMTAGLPVPVRQFIAVERGKSTTGAVLFLGEQYKALLKPPFPFEESPVFYGYEGDIIRSLMNKDYLVAVLLVRLGMYSVGIFKGEQLLSSKSGTGLVHSRHKKGGSSQRRFERHREKQIEYFFTRVCGHVREQVEPYLDMLDYVRYGGEHITVNSFRKQCAFTKKLDNHVIEALLGIRDPKRASLQAAIEEAWSSKIIEWRDEPSGG
jgi:hypothetical protein